MNARYGTVVAVEARQAGTQLVGAHSAGVTSLTVLDLTEIPDSGSLLVGSDTLAYTAVSDTDNPDLPVGPSVVTLTAATTNAYSDGALVTVTPVKPYKVALVILDGESVAIECRVKHHWQDTLAEGLRGIGGGESVAVVRGHDGDYLIDDVLGSQLARAGEYLDPNSPITPGAITTSWDSNASDFASRAHPEMLGSGDVTGTLDVRGAVKTGGSGAGGTTLDAAGFRTYRSTGEPRSGFLNDDDQPDILRGVVDGTKGNFTEGVYLDGVNVLGQGASFQLHSSIDPPHLEPTVFTDWPCVDVAFPDPLIQGIQPSDRFGFALKSGTEAYCLLHTATSGGGIGTGGTFSFTVAKFNPTDGTYVGTYTFAGQPGIGTPTSISYSSLTDRLVTLEIVGSAYMVRTWHMPSGSTVAFDAQWATPQIQTGNVPSPALAVKNIIGTEYVVIAQPQALGASTIKIRNYVAQTLVETMTTTATYNMGSLVGMAHLGGTIVLAGMTTYLNSGGSPALPVFDVSGFFAPKGTLLGALQVGNGDPLAAGIATWDADTEKARTWYLSRASNSVIQHSNVFEAGAYWAQAAWGDSATGHLTLPSSAVLVQKIPGSRVTIGLGEMPTGVDSAMLYFGAGGSYPGVAGMWSQNTLTAGSAYVQVFTVHNAAPFVNPLTVATLTGGTPAKIVNAAGVTLLDANSTPGGGGSSGVDDDVFFAANGDIIVTARA